MANLEERIGKDGKKTYRVKVRLKGFPSQSASFERKTDAKKWASHVEAAIREGRYFKSSEARRHTLGEAVDRYIENVLSARPKTLRDQKRQLIWWKENLGAYSLAEITPPKIAEARDQLARGTTKRNSTRSPATVNRYLAALSRLYTITVREWGWTETNPVRRVSKLKEPRGRVRFLNDQERLSLIEACQESEHQDLYHAVILALSTGARKMELMALRWTQVDFGREMITLEETKNGERRALPLKGLAQSLLKQRNETRRLDTDLVFPANQSPGKAPKPIDLRDPWEKALKQAEISDFRWHDLRHTAASYLAMNGASLAEIAEILGHKTLQMVKRYAHLSDAHTSQVVESMNTKIFGNGVL